MALTDAKVLRVTTALATPLAGKADASVVEALETLVNAVESDLADKQTGHFNLQALSDLQSIPDGGMLVSNGDDQFVILPSSLIGRTVLGGTAEQGRNALDAASAYGLYNATFGLGEVTAEVTDGGSEIYNGAVLTGPMYITTPPGTVGNVSYIRMNWPFDGAAHVGKTFRFRLRLATSATFDRPLLYQMSVATESEANDDRTSTVTSQVDGTQIVITFDYVVQGDETAIRPFVMINPSASAATASAQFFRFTGLSVGVAATNNGLRTAADENIALLRESILSQTILRPTYAETIRVKPSGGDFTTLAAAMAAITDSSVSKQYRVAWHAGATLGTPDFHVPAWTSVICQDPRDDAVISFTNPDNASAETISNTSLLWIDEDGVVIEGGTWQIENGRYVFHWETNGLKPGTEQRLIGLKAVHLGNADAVNNTWVSFSQYACGCGVSGGQVQIVEDCDLRGPGGGFSSHSPNNGQPWENPFRIHISGSRLEATDAANKDLLLKPIAFGPGEARIVGCSYDQIGYFDGEWFGGDPGGSVNTAQIAVYGRGNANLADSGKPTFFNGVVFGNATGKAYAGMFTGI